MISKWFLVLLGTLSIAALSWSQDLGEWTDSYVKGLPPAKHFSGTVVAERNGQVLAEGDLVSVDFGATLHGWCGDAACSFIVGTPRAQTMCGIAAPAD